MLGNKRNVAGMAFTLGKGYLEREQFEEAGDRFYEAMQLHYQPISEVFGLYLESYGRRQKLSSAYVRLAEG